MSDSSQTRAADTLVSVVAPAYRHERYIADCLRSIAAQTHPRLEVIVVDDASGDGTADVAEATLEGPLKGRFERAVVRRQASNGGAHAALNDGLALARGAYVAVINTDDLFLPERIERLLAAMVAADSGFGFTGIELLWDEDSAPPPPGVVLLNLRQRLAIARDRTLGHALLRQNVAISTGNFLFSRALAQRIGGFQPLRYCHDWDFALQALLHTQPVFVEAPLYAYRLHAGNTFRQTGDLALLESEAVIRRYFRAVLSREQTNRHCPSPDSEPGAFEAFVHLAKYGDYWAREAGLYRRASRTLAARPIGDHPGDVATAFRLLAERLAVTRAAPAEIKRLPAEAGSAASDPAPVTHRAGTGIVA